MNISRGEKHIVIEFKNSELTVDAIEKALNTVNDKYENENIILKMDEVSDITDEAFNSLSFWNDYVLKNKRSFIIASLIEDLWDGIPEIEKTHTLSEAQDIIFLEEVERDIDNHFEENY